MNDLIYKFLVWIGVMLLVSSSASKGVSQSFYFGPKAGIAINTQQWNNFDRDPLFSLHGDVFIESYSEDATSSLFAQLGFHTRGSSIRGFGINTGNSFTNSFKFHNLMFMAGAKQILNREKKFRPYYLFGVRAEYTVGTNLTEFERFQSTFYPFDFYVNKFLYGLTIGGGFEYDMGELYGGFIEFNLHPDVSLQYEQPAIPNVINPFDGRTVTLGERSIRNLSLEITVGIRFLRKVEYY